jgi:hypothetical protein
MNEREKLFRDADAKRRECRDWLKQFMQPGQPKPMTKEELFELAKGQVGISRSGFDQAWIGAIEEMGRHDWYEPTRKRRTRLH